MAPPQQPSSRQPLSSNIETLSYVNGMVEAFKAFDSDNDGLITTEELGGIMGSLGYNTNDEEVKEMMRQGDSDGDGLLSAAEFLGMMSNAVELDVGDLAGLLETALSALGADVGDEGAVTVTGEELYEVLSSMGRLSVDNCMDIIASLDGDGDGDGTVNLEDLKLIVQALL